MGIMELLSEIRKNIFFINMADWPSRVHNDGIMRTLTYFMVLVLITVPIFFGIQLFDALNKPALLLVKPSVVDAVVSTLFATVLYLLLSPLVVLLYSGIIHILVKLLGGKESYGKTLQIQVYGGTLGALLSQIPCLNFLAALTALGNVVQGVRAIHGLSLLRAIIAVVVIPVLLLIILIFLLVSVFLISGVSGGSYY